MDKAEQIREKLRGVVDPEVGMNLVEMNMIEEITVEGDRAKIVFKPTSSFCPIAFYLAQQVKSAAESVIKRADVYVRGHMMEEQINKTINAK
jgi:ATP-binding protein involved in chromosome partitioning